MFSRYWHCCVHHVAACERRDRTSTRSQDAPGSEVGEPNSRTAVCSCHDVCRWWSLNDKSSSHITARNSCTTNRKISSIIRTFHLNERTKRVAHYTQVYYFVSPEWVTDCNREQSVNHQRLVCPPTQVYALTVSHCTCTPPVTKDDIRRQVKDWRYRVSNMLHWQLL